MEPPRILICHRSRSVRRNASSYQESFSGEIKSCGVKMIYHSARERIGDGAKLSPRLGGERCGGADLWQDSPLQCFAHAWCQKRMMIWCSVRIVKNGITWTMLDFQPLPKIVKIGIVPYAEYSFYSSLSFALCTVTFSPSPYTVTFNSSLYNVSFNSWMFWISFWEFMIGGIPSILGFSAGGANYIY